MSDDIYAEDMNYWQTSSSSSDTWMEKTMDLIEDFGGTVLQHAFGSEPQTGRSAYMMMFTLEGDHFKVVWPVLSTKGGNNTAAKRQAATMLYHDTKAKLLQTHIMGARTAYFANLLLPDGRTASEASTEELADRLPSFLSTPQLIEGEIIE